MLYQNRKESLFVKVTENNACRAHIHRQAEIFYVLDGAIEATISGHKKLLTAGMASVAFPNVVHETCTPDHSSAVMILFHPDFLPDFFQEFHTQIPQNPFIDHIEDNAATSQALSGLLESIQSHTDIRISKGYLYILVSMLLPLLSMARQDSMSIGICQNISSYLDIHFTEDINLSRLASELGYSKYHISHIFKENFGCSYSEYLKRLRSEHAMGLLTHSDMTATQICFACGFNSLRSFYRAFREIYGTAPGSVR